MTHSFKRFLGYGLVHPESNELLTHQFTGNNTISFDYTKNPALALCVNRRSIETLKQRAFKNHRIVKIYKTKKSYVFT